MSPPKPRKRRVSARAVRRSLLVFVEGTVTEEEYLNHIRRTYRQSVTVQFDDARGTPLTLVKAAVAAKKEEERRARRKEGSAHDEVWCVFDVDEHPHLAEAISVARDHNICLAISNPCVELWFLLHFAEQSAYLDRRSAQSAAKEHLRCGKSLTPAALGLLDAGYALARARARALEGKHQGDGTPAPGNPSSGVWQLVDSIAVSRD